MNCMTQVQCSFVVSSCLVLGDGFVEGFGLSSSEKLSAEGRAIELKGSVVEL
jgi:hypothetical protein